MNDSVDTFRRYVHFDGLRAIAVAMVMYEHWIFVARDHDTCNKWYDYLFRISLGYFGVTIFFVLSGFLITGILIKGQGLEGRAKSRFLRAFYLRRSLRIFPVYFLLILVAAWLVKGSCREDFLWLALYGTNILVFLKQSWIGPPSHLWTLAVEEQFYLVLPILVLFFARNLRQFLVGVLIFSFIYRLGFTLFLPDVKFPEILPIVSMQALVIGGLLALPGGDKDVLYRIAQPLALLLPLFFLLAMFRPSGAIFNHPIIGIVGGYSVVGFSVVLVAKAMKGYRGPLGAFFDLRAIRYLGLISYGLYLYHNFAAWGWGLISRNTGFPYDTLDFAWQVPLNAMLTVSIAILSWEIVERPLNGLKRFFPY
ncbi:acyltransferase [uncultured Thiodictyon sp.]|uniref:acyltransferase family protein n=1 Tax=uncultured Thiodictyon sp. TaxID=1846217 RepID=UPI0025D47146|nr:acyltransferase [uncultured Thiodictyon sp.]